MNKLFRIITAVCVLAMLLSCVLTANAAMPTTITLTEVSKAPVIDGELDDVYGDVKWDLSATDITVGNYNLFPRTEEELEPMKDAYNVMNMKGYFVYDKEGIYIAVAAKDVAPRAASNSEHFCYSTNIQVVLYVNSSRNFFTVAYTGEDKVNFINEENRSELDFSKMTANDYKFKNDDKGNLFYEIKLPYEALYGVKSMDDIKDMRIGVVQTSMAYGYLCSAFGEAYDLDYERLLPVKVQALSGDAPVSNQTTTTTSEVVDDATANTDGLDFSGSSEDEQSNVPEAETPANTAPQKDYTMIIIFGVAAGVVLIVGVVAVILVNKKK